MEGKLNYIVAVFSEYPPILLLYVTSINLNPVYKGVITVLCVDCRYPCYKKIATYGVQVILLLLVQALYSRGML